MTHLEIESLIKSFVLFFISLSLLVGTLFYLAFEQECNTLDESLLSEMRLCSFDLKCEQFRLDFAVAQQKELYRLTKDLQGVHSYFPISQSAQYVLEFTYSNKDYQDAISHIQEEKIRQFLIVMLVIAMLSALFSFYALHPIRTALTLTKEFVKDILHDFNTPLSALRLNIGMLKRDVGENNKIVRIEQGIATILALQSNLRSYLDQHVAQKEPFELSAVINERVMHLQTLFPGICFKLSLESLNVNANRDALIRVVDNLLSNAAKYNKKGGSVEVTLLAMEKMLVIKDTGKGIKVPEKVFKRFYTEQERGIGIGLHIVKKLCDEMKIPISLESEVGVGSAFRLDLSALTLR